MGQRLSKVFTALIFGLAVYLVHVPAGNAQTAGTPQSAATKNTIEISKRLLNAEKNLTDVRLQVKALNEKLILSHSLEETLEEILLEKASLANSSIVIAQYWFAILAITIGIGGGVGLLGSKVVYYNTKQKIDDHIKADIAKIRADFKKEISIATMYVEVNISQNISLTWWTHNETDFQNAIKKGSLRELLETESFIRDVQWAKSSAKKALNIARRDDYQAELHTRDKYWSSYIMLWNLYIYLSTFEIMCDESANYLEHKSIKSLLVEIANFEEVRSDKRTESFWFNNHETCIFAKMEIGHKVEKDTLDLFSDATKELKRLISGKYMPHKLTIPEEEEEKWLEWRQNICMEYNLRHIGLNLMIQKK